jgi:regulator of replication initiation timing
MPKIFIKILNAIKDENTELLQECLEEYHTRYIENKRLKSENENILETIKKPYDDIKPKYEILVKEHDELKLEYEKLKHEFELLKIKMEEQRKLYMG